MRSFGTATNPRWQPIMKTCLHSPKALQATVKYSKKKQGLFDLLVMLSFVCHAVIRMTYSTRQNIFLSWFSTPS